MHISSVEIHGFRGLDLTVSVANPLGLLVGPNNAGKTAVIDALRSILQPYAGRTGQRWITASDFTKDEKVDGADIAELKISVLIADIPTNLRGRMISILSPLLGANCAKLTLKSILHPSGRIVSNYYGGDMDHADVESMARDAVQFVYLPALRDATADLRPGQGNRLPNLLSSYAPPGHTDRDLIIKIATEANDRLETVGAIVQSANEIQSRLSKITGSGPFAHRTGLRFSAARYDKIVTGLQALAGDTSPGALSDNGLGYNNLLYMSVLLAALQRDEETPLTILLVEEPEAHLHPQLQTLLMHYLESLALTDTQVIATTHSPQLAASAQIDRVTAVARSTPGASPTARALKDAGLDGKSTAYLQRFLDVTRSSILFARGVILVEGIAEQLLLPALANMQHVSLPESGVSVISVDGVAFEPFMKLFGANGLPARCAVRVSQQA